MSVFIASSRVIFLYNISCSNVISSNVVPDFSHHLKSNLIIPYPKTDTLAASQNAIGMVPRLAISINFSRFNPNCTPALIKLAADVVVFTISPSIAPLTKLIVAPAVDAIAATDCAISLPVADFILLTNFVNSRIILSTLSDGAPAFVAIIVIAPIALTPSITSLFSSDRFIPVISAPFLRAFLSFKIRVFGSSVFRTIVNFLFILSKFLAMSSLLSAITLFSK